MGRKKKPITGYGEGTIFFSNTQNKWMGQINIGRGDDGKMKRKTVYGKTADEVKSKLQQVRFDIYTGDFVHPSSITFEQLEKQVLDDKLAMNEIQEQTYHRHMETLKRLASINKQPLQKINYSMLKHLLLSLVDEYADSTIRKIYMMLNQCFNEAVKRKIISESPMGDLKKPKSRKKGKVVRALTIDEQKAFIEALKIENSRYANQFLISMFTGMRMGEVNALTIGDINTKFNFINIDKTISKGQHGEAFVNSTTKTKTGIRQVPINEAVKPIITQILNEYVPTDDGMLFHTSTGTLVASNTTNTEFQKIMKKYNIKDNNVKGDLSQHSLRHTYATRCIEGNMPPKVLQTLLGHADIRITLDTYSNVFESFQTENVAKIDNYLSDLGIAI